MFLLLFDTLIYVFLLLCLSRMFMYLHRASLHFSATLTEVCPCFFLRCKANARIKPAKMGQGTHSSKLLCCSMYCFVSFCVLCM